MMFKMLFSEKTWKCDGCGVTFSRWIDWFTHKCQY